MNNTLSEVKSEEPMDHDYSTELSADTLALLNEFLQNKDAQDNQADFFEEDWELSQFWYSEETKQKLAKVCSELVLKHQTYSEKSTINIALLSCPSIYKIIKEQSGSATVIRLFEYDERFASFGDDFVYYDYNDEKRNQVLFKEYGHSFDIIFLDCPFLSSECVQKFGDIIKYLKKEDTDILMCSGQIASDWIKTFIHLNECEFRPEHARNLANEFCSYANFDLDAIIKNDE